MTEKRDSSEEKKVAAGYIVDFYGDVLQLTAQYGIYTNVCLEAEEEKRASGEKGVTEETAKQIKDHSHQTRFLVMNTYIKYKTLLTSVPALKGKDEVKDLYNKVKTQLIIERDVIEAVVIKFNEFIAKEVMKRLLQTSQDIVGEMFKDGGEHKSI